jgi:hypothetical protein
MIRLLLLVVVTILITGCASSLTVCDEALRTRQAAKSAPLEQKEALEAKAAGLENACAREREQSVQQQKDWNEQNRRRWFAEARGRTGMMLPSLDFESAQSTKNGVFYIKNGSLQMYFKVFSGMFGHFWAFFWLTQYNTINLFLSFSISLKECGKGLRWISNFFYTSTGTMQFLKLY